DKLAEELGGPPTPGIGFGIGIERVLIACDSEGVLPATSSAPDVFVVDATGSSETGRLVYELREAGLSVDRSYGSRAVKKQWSAADRSGARFGVMIAPREMERGCVAVKDLRSDAEQQEVQRGELAGWLQMRLGGTGQ